MLTCNSTLSIFNIGQAAILIGSQRDPLAAVAHRLAENFRGATVEQLSFPELGKTKRCTGECGEVKPLERFTPTSDPRRGKDGYRGQCKDCHAARERARRGECPERNVLTLMIQRCHNPNHPKFRYWGGRGIRVCDEWRAKGGIDLFLAHIGPRPTPKHEIDRYPDKNGNYEPGNVRWATRYEQMMNTNRTRFVTAFNKTLTLDEWAAETGIKRRTLEWRYDEKWPPEQIVRPSLYKFFKKRGKN